jgi:glycosyltransferase involved in cell wall biosynthesis
MTVEIKLSKPIRDIDLSVIIPSFNEAANLEAGVLDEVAAYLDSQGFSWEVIIVDDESTDNSLALCKQFAAGHSNFRVIQAPHGGKPHALYVGLVEAESRLVLFTDMDQSTPIHELEKLKAWFEHGFDVVIGSRGNQRAGFSPIRQITSWGFRNLRRMILLSEIMDTQCGFKMLKTEVAREIFPKLSFLKSKKEQSGWMVSAYDVELLYLARLSGYRIKEVEVAWSHNDKSVTKGNNRKRSLRESLEMGKEVLTIIGNKVSGKY